MPNWFKIPCAVDFPRSSSVALGHAADLARHFAAELTVVHAHEEIIGVARSQAFDLVVTGTHARAGLRHLLLGPVAERVVRAAPREPPPAGG